jgi:hypothetical protein
VALALRNLNRNQDSGDNISVLMQRLRMCGDILPFHHTPSRQVAVRTGTPPSLVLLLHACCRGRGGGVW